MIVGIGTTSSQETEKAIEEAKDQTVDSQKPVIVTYDKGSDRYGIRYTELISPIIKAVQELKARLDRLEKALSSK